MLEGRTAIVVAHRLSKVQVASRVLVVTDGRITDDARRVWLESNS